MSSEEFDKIIYSARTAVPLRLTLNVFTKYWDHFDGGVLATALRSAGVTLKHHDSEELIRDPSHAYLAWDPHMDLKLPDDVHEKLSPIRVINGGRPNTEKGHVKSVFSQVFGYGFDVDPTHYAGLAAAKKSSDNGSHSGVTISCPIDKPEPGYTYDRLISNDFGEVSGERFVVDLRTVIINGVARLVYGKVRPLASRYSNINSYARMLTPFEVFSSNELDLIETFCDEMNMDYGEIDILRDKDDGNLYIVDVNNTPYGPPNYIRHGERDVALRSVADLALRSFWPSCEIVRRQSRQ
jgi:hypothetical protein